MKKYVFLVLGMLLSCAFNINAEPGVLSKLYGYIFGNQPACQEYQEQVKEALSALGSNSNEIMVRQMNGVGPSFARQELSSFTGFGIWVNEKFFNTLPKSEQTFQLYHESAHYAQKHHQKLLVAGIVLLPILGFGLKKLHNYCTSKSLRTAYRRSIVGGALCASLAILYLWILPKVVKMQEKQADIMAAQVLIDSGQHEIVNSHLEELMKDESSSSSLLWWPTIKDQIEYLQGLIK